MRFLKICKRFLRYVKFNKKHITKFLHILLQNNNVYIN